jgi:two-component system, OmpR family, sensor histidine kinase SenX3
MDVNAAVAAASAIAGVCTGAFAVLAFRWSEREQARPTRSSLHTDAALPPGVDTVLSVLRSSAVVLDEGDTVVKASSAAYALGLVRGGRLAVDRMLQMARETRRDGEIRQIELDLPRRSGRGEPLAVSARVAPLGSRLVLLLVEDLTEARRIEAVRRDFVANVSHELKTPVGALSLLSEAVMDASDDPEAVNRFAGRMQAEATRLTSLVQEIIDLSRVQNDDPLEDAEAVPVDELVAEAVDRCRHPANAKQITMATVGVPDLYVWGHRGQLAAALGNLVENAVNYSPARTRVGIVGKRVSRGGGAGSRAAGSAGMIEISVTDQGTGISQADRERIFERFYRVDPARSRATGGTGLGLSIVKHVAASHGGEVTVWSAEGQGSTFTLRLPEAAGARSPDSRDPEHFGPGDRAVEPPDDQDMPYDAGLPDDPATADDRPPPDDLVPAANPVPADDASGGTPRGVVRRNRAKARPRLPFTTLHPAPEVLP